MVVATLDLEVEEVRQRLAPCGLTGSDAQITAAAGATGVLRRQSQEFEGRYCGFLCKRLRLAIERIGHRRREICAQLIIGKRDVIRAPSPDRCQQMDAANSRVVRRSHPVVTELVLHADIPGVILRTVKLPDGGSSALIGVSPLAIGLVGVVRIRLDRRVVSEAAWEGAETMVLAEFGNPMLAIER